MTKRDVHVVVTCSQSKRGEVHDRHRLRSITSPSPQGRFGKWRTALLRDGLEERTSARDVYCGDHWSVARSIEGMTTHQGQRVHLWIASAGYGLLSPDEDIVPYQATFQSGNADSVDGDARSEWWRLLCEWSLGEHPRSLHDLAKSDPSSTILLVLSSPYLRAVRDDALAAMRALRDTNQMTVISGGIGRDDPLLPVAGPLDARMQSRVGGTLISLNVRVARWVLNSRDLGRDAITRKLERAMSETPEFEKPKREARTDDEVRDFILPQLSADPRISKTRVLRMLREAGFACEQSRFSKLFKVIKEQQGA